MPTTAAAPVLSPLAGLPLRTGNTLSDDQVAQASSNLGNGSLPSPRLCFTGGVPSQVADGNATNNGLGDTTVVATTTYIAEVYVPQACLVTGFASQNGSAGATGNIKIALYNKAGTLVAQSASVAGVGTDAFQRVPFTAPVTIRPGTYFVALQRDNTSDKVTTHTFGNFSAWSVISGTYGTMPTTITDPGTFTTAVGPVGGLY